MSILIDTVRIAGFRGIKNLEVSLPRVAILIGQNNSGKTSFLKALQLALGDYSRALSEEDFHIGSNGHAATEILVDMRIVPTDTNGNKTQQFSTAWQADLGDKIKAEASGQQFVATRIRAKRDPLKGSFDSKRTTLEKWPDFANWTTDKIRETNLTRRLESLPFFAIEAQRDIHQELRERTSFVGRVLSGIKYDSGDIATLEELIKEVNDQAVSKSDELKSLKANLEELNKSFQGGGNAEITPFPKKIRDLSKHVSVHFGEDSASSFSMEYHGMGTRSWASLLTVKAFAELLGQQHASEEKPFFPIFAAEEPEAHLHPNAQKTIYRQLAASKGQVIVSTHSPYLAAIAKNRDIRGLKRAGDNVKILLLPELEPEDQRRLHREVIHSRGEILFSKAIVLCEGETEEQALPLLFKTYFECHPFELGINFVGVGGAGKYLPFFSFSTAFDIPVFFFSDGEPNIVRDLKKHYESIFGTTDVTSCPNITILPNDDFEGYLMANNCMPIFETVISELDGADKIENWKNMRQGTDTGKRDSAGNSILRDYTTTGGHERAISEIIDKHRFSRLV